MKRFLVYALAAIGMVACVNEDVVQLPKSDTIRFADAFINNSTRAAKAEDPSTTKETLEAFDVWAYMTSLNGTVLVDEDVELKNGNWDYANLQYWTPEKNYFFAALAPMNSDNWHLYTENAVFDGGAGLVTFENIDGSEDLLYATASVRTPNMATLQDRGMETVKFQFAHLLSKVKFTFYNGFLTENATLKIENIKMTAPKSGHIDLGGDSKWVLGANNFKLEFGNAGELSKAVGMPDNAQCDRERLTIPADENYTYDIEFDVTLYYGTEVAYKVHKESTVTGVALEKGKAYNFVAEINPENLHLAPIVFEVKGVDAWVPEGGEQVDVDYFYDEASNTYSVATAEGMVDFAEDINDGTVPADATVVLSGDIDLSAITRAVVSNWTPIGTEEKPFTGTFDGKGYAIKNLALVESEAKEGKVHTGFIGYGKDATIKNVTFENVYINIPCLDIDHSQGHIGAVAGTLEGTSIVENVTVKGDIQVESTLEANGASRVAVVVGGNTYANVTMKNVHVIANEGSYLKANNNVGALAGQLQGVSVFENCSSNIDVTGYKFFAGGIIGLAAGNQTFTNCHTTGDVTILAGREGRANDHYRVGGIAGGWADNTATPCVLTNCSYTGKISGKNADGAVAEVLDYWGYVGRGYTLSNRAGSRVIIDGTEFVQKYNDVYGVYTINGCTPVSTADELVAALEANEGVYFLNDIKIDPASMSNAYGATGINIKNGQTIDGGGHTLNIKGAGGTWDSGINTTGGIIRNITVTGSFRGIFINHTSTHSEKVVLEGVTTTGTVYTISCDQGLYQGIEATNCSFYGWTSFAKTAGEAKFVNCYFGEGSGYKYCRPYSNTEFVNCTFCPGYAVDTTRATVVFTDCTFEE